MSDWHLSRGEYERLQGLLSEVFGLRELRPFQADVMARLLKGQSVLAVVSTGAGKSLCYQLPALYWDKPVMVISPLVALMHDQAGRMRDLGIPAAALTGYLRRDEQEDLLETWAKGQMRLLYAAPERLSDPRLSQALRRCPPALLVVDEAHCISAWGYDFRPEYRRIRAFRQTVGNPPLLALTATATARVKADIRFHLTMNEEPFDLVDGPVDRPNLFLAVEMVASAKARERRVAELVQEADGGVIIYTGSRANAEYWARTLSGLLHEAVRPYHAGLAPPLRRRIEQEFVGRAVRVVASTTAFGMGIDRSDIRAVVHVHVPDSLDAYYQEIGRAGRDGKPASAVMVILPMDRHRRERWIHAERPEAAWIVEVLDRLQAQPANRPVIWQVEDDDTRTPVLLSVLEEMGALTLAGGSRGIRVVRRPVAVEAEAVVHRLEQFWHRRRDLFQHMRRYIESSTCRRVPLLAYYGQSSRPSSRCCDQCASGNRATVAPSADAQLVERLRVWRSLEAQKAGVEPYIVMSDRDLMGLAVKRPQSLDALAQCHGMGPRRMVKYGQTLVAILAQASHEGHGGEVDQTSAADRAVWLFRAGVPWDRVRAEVARSESTLRGYFIAWIKTAPEVEWRHYLATWFTRREYEIMADVMTELGTERLRPLFDALSGQFRFDQWDVARAVFRRLGRAAYQRGEVDA